MKRYGIPYQGTKSKIAGDIINILPSADYFVDLFAGGCAMTHAAMLSGKYQNFIINDISDAPQVFTNAIKGKYSDERRWISREDFFALKDTDPYVRIFWSFGYNQVDYLYSKEIEAYKRAFHHAVMFGDYVPMKAFNMDWSELDNVQGDYTEKRLYVKRVIIPRYYSLDKKQRRKLSDIENVERLQSLERLRNLQSLERLRNLQSDYKDVEIPEFATVYADPPYQDTRSYLNRFDSEDFFQWARTRTFPVYISEYKAPSDFICIFKKGRVSSMCAINNNLRVVEKVFVHERFADKIVHPTLF